MFIDLPGQIMHLCYQFCYFLILYHIECYKEKERNEIFHCTLHRSDLTSGPASKFAAVGFHESLAHELLAEEFDGVKTTLVCPYIVDTGMFEGCKIRYVSELLTCSHPCLLNRD